MALGPCAPNADLGHDKVMIKSSNKIEHSEENLSFEKKIGALGVGKSLMVEGKCLHYIIIVFSSVYKLAD